MITIHGTRYTDRKCKKKTETIDDKKDEQLLDRSLCILLKKTKNETHFVALIDRVHISMVTIALVV